MSSISAGTTLSTSLVHTGDTTGRLLFKTNGTTTALTLDSAQNAVLVGSLTAPSAVLSSSLTASGLSYPTADGTSGYAIVTNGSGTLSFAKVSRDPILVDSNTNAVIGSYYVATTGGITITLPASPDSGDYVEIHDGTGAAASSSITIGRNGSSIASAAEDFTLDVNFAKLHMVYVGGSVGWTV